MASNEAYHKSFAQLKRFIRQGISEAHSPCEQNEDESKKQKYLKEKISEIKKLPLREEQKRKMTIFMKQETQVMEIEIW